MKFVLYLLCSVAIITTALAASGQQSLPCEILASTIVCQGHKVTDDSLPVLKDVLHSRYRMSYFMSLIITETDLNHIPAATFEDITFENLMIEGNAHLRTIDQTAFAEQSCKTLYIINNPLLSDNSLYRLTSRLQVYESVDFDFNSLKEIPTNAFLPKHEHLNFRKLVLSNNQITKIHHHAFERVPNCEQIYLNQNQLATIETNAFNLTANTNDKILVNIHLANNQLNDKSFGKDFLVLTPGQQLLATLDLSSNKLTTLDQKIFEPLLQTKRVILDLANNKLDCSKLQWLTLNQTLHSQIKGVFC